MSPLDAARPLAAPAPARAQAERHAEPGAPDEAFSAQLQRSTHKQAHKQADKTADAAKPKPKGTLAKREPKASTSTDVSAGSAEAAAGLAWSVMAPRSDARSAQAGGVGAPAGAIGPTTGASTSATPAAASASSASSAAEPGATAASLEPAPQGSAKTEATADTWATASPGAETGAPAAEPIDATQAQAGVQADAAPARQPRWLPSAAAGPGPTWSAAAPALRGDAAEASLAASQAKVEAFSSGLLQARQLTQKGTQPASGTALRPSLRAAAPAHINAVNAANAVDALAFDGTGTDAVAPDLRAGLEAKAGADSAPATQAVSVAPAAEAERTGLGEAAPGQAAAPRTDTLAHAVGSNPWGLALSQHLVKMFQAGQQTTELQLNPSALGPLKVSLTLGEQQLQARFESAHGEVGLAIEAALPQLRSVLADSGIALTQTWVQQGGQHAAFSAGHSGEQRDSGHPPAPAPTALTTRTAPQHAPAAAERQGLLDIYA